MSKTETLSENMCFPETGVMIPDFGQNIDKSFLPTKKVAEKLQEFLKFLENYIECGCRKPVNPKNPNGWLCGDRIGTPETFYFCDECRKKEDLMINKIKEIFGEKLLGVENK